MKMAKLRTIVACTLGAVLLPACVTPPSREIAMKPVLQVRHSTALSATSLYEMGKYHQSEGRLDLALRAYQEAIRLDKRHFEARNALATIYSQQGHFVEAKALLRELIMERPDMVHTYNNLGYVHYLEGDLDSSVTVLEKAIRLDGKNQRARNNLEMAQAALAKRYDSLAEHSDDTKPKVAASAPADETWGEVSGVGAPPEQVAAQSKNPPNPAAPGVLPDAAESGGTNVAAVVVAPQISAPQIEAPQVEAPRIAPPRVAAFQLEPSPVEASRGRAEERTISPTIESVPSRMQVVQLLPNVYELKPTQQPSFVALDESLIPAAAQTPARKFRFEVSNGNGVTGMAQRVGNYLTRYGLPSARLTNQRPFQQRETEIQFRKGFETQAARVSTKLKGVVKMIPTDQLRSSSDVRLVLGKDNAQNLAILEILDKEMLLALNRASVSDRAAE